MLNEFAIFKSYLTYNVIKFDTNILEQIPHNRSHKYNNTYVVIIFSNNCLVSALFFVSQNLREFIHPIYSCKEKERCGRGNCDLKRNVTNLLSWNILLTKKIFWTTHINFSSYHYTSQILFSREDLFHYKSSISTTFYFHFDFFLACRDNVTPKFYYKIRKKEDTIFHCFSSFYIVIKYVSFKEWNARFFFFLNKVKN